MTRRCKIDCNYIKKAQIIGLILPCEDSPILDMFSEFFWTINHRYQIEPALL